MDNKQYNALFSFIWNIAKDVLVHAFDIVDYTPFLTQVTGYPFYNTNSSPSISTSPCSSAHSMLSWRTSAA